MSVTKNQVTIVLICIASLVVIYFYLIFDRDCLILETVKVKNSLFELFEDDNETGKNWPTIKQCLLPNLDPFNPGIDSVIPEHVNIFENCKPSFQIKSELKNGTLFIDETVLPCSYRCIFSKGEVGQIPHQKWNSYDAKSPPKPKCDFVEIDCPKKYAYLHHQVFIPPNEEIINKTGTSPRPSVYIFGIDAMSNPMFHRYLYRTAYWSEHDMNGFNFLHYSKLGRNSIPNQFVATFGKYFYSNKNPTEYGIDYSSEFDSIFCTKKISMKEQFISLVFKDAGYRTARIFDDQMVHDLACSGFESSVHDNKDQPFYSFFNDEKLTQKMHNESCRNPVHDYFDRFMSFAETETKKPKFVFHMIVQIGHDKPETAYSYDKYFHDGFRKNMDKFDNDFLIFWSDHGNHFGKIFDSNYGFNDTRNPLLTIIPPKKYRNNLNHPIFKNLFINSKKLISHFDFYATLVDIATANFEIDDFAQPLTPELVKNKTNGRVTVFHGSSLLRPLIRPNNCPAARIPFFFCQCQYRRFIPDDLESIKSKIVHPLWKASGEAPKPLPSTTTAPTPTTTTGPKWTTTATEPITAPNATTTTAPKPSTTTTTPNSTSTLLPTTPTAESTMPTPINVYSPVDDIMELFELEIKLKNKIRLFYVKLRIYNNYWLHDVGGYVQLYPNGTTKLVSDYK